jgi:hypothetical protein
MMVIFGGEHIEGATDSVLEEYSLLDINTLTWTSGFFDFVLRPTMAMSSATFGSNVYCFGGVETPAGLAHDSLWRYSMVSDQWQSLHTANALPGNRALALVAPNLEDQQLFLFGGTAGAVSDPPAGAANFRLSLANLTWLSTAAPGPPALVEGGAIYDSADHRVLIWGGRDGGGGLPVEVWEFALGAQSWRQVPTVGLAPAGRTGHRLVYDAAHRRFVMFGGKTGVAWNDETWELSW